MPKKRPSNDNGNDNDRSSKKKHNATTLSTTETERGCEAKEEGEEKKNKPGDRLLHILGAIERFTDGWVRDDRRSNNSRNLSLAWIGHVCEQLRVELRKAWSVVMDVLKPHISNSPAEICAHYAWMTAPHHLDGDCRLDETIVFLRAQCGITSCSDAYRELPKTPDEALALCDVCDGPTRRQYVLQGSRSLRRLTFSLCSVCGAPMPERGMTRKTSRIPKYVVCTVGSLYYQCRTE
jgi:hypothetical protein